MEEPLSSLVLPTRRKVDDCPNLYKIDHHCLPITCLKLVEGLFLVASEGPSVLLKMAYLDKPFQRYQLFQSDLVISGMEFESYPKLECGDNPQQLRSDYVHVGFVWAGSVASIVRIRRSCKGELKVLDNDNDKLIRLDFIPVAAKWLEGGNILALLSVLNYLVIYERTGDEGGPFTSVREVARVKCDKSETLFSGQISGTSRTDMRIFGGTVFNGICVWDVKGNEGVIRHHLKCHDGIIFSVEYYPCQNILLSTSDDRTVAVWQFSEGEKEVNLLHRFYGHDARVWKALLVRNYVISVSESSDIRVNNLKDGKEHKCWRGHGGAPIFTCVYDQDGDILYSGGAEGSIRKWPKWWYRLQPRTLPFDVIPSDDQSRIQGSGRWKENKDFPKTVQLLDINHVIASMESGRVIGMTWEGEQFDLLHDSRCEGYQIIRLSPDHKVLAVAGKDGHFYTAEINTSVNESSKRSVMYARKLFMTKISWNILSMIWVDVSRLLIICYDRVVAIQFEEKEGVRSEAKIIQTFHLNLQRPGIPAAVEVDGNIVLGDELGALHLFKYSKPEAIKKVEGVHKDGVTSLLFHASKLYSTGADGLVKVFSIEDDLQVVQVAIYSMPFEWVTGIYCNMGQMLVCGFQKEDLVVYSLNEKRSLAKIPCGGGGNRKWDFKYGHGSAGSADAAFAFVNNKEIYYTFLPMAGYLNVIMKEGLHSRTINCALPLPSSRKETFDYVSGSEDGTIKWFQWDRTKSKLLCVESMENHVSSVRSLCKIEVSNQTFLFSGGGRSQVSIYRIDFKNKKMDLLKEIILVKRNWKVKRTDGDVRIMDIAVEEVETELLSFCACSDGLVRTFLYNPASNSFKLVNVLNGNSHALMRIQLLKTDSETLLLGGVTSNGYFILWKLAKNNFRVDSKSQALAEIQAEHLFLMRRTAFLSMQVKNERISDELLAYRIICGGDDTSVSCWSLEIVREGEGGFKYSLRNEWTRDYSQRGAVVGVHIGERIYTLSNDQIVCVWSKSGDLERTRYAGVTDCQGFLVDGENESVLCFGKGVSWLSL